MPVITQLLPPSTPRPRMSVPYIAGLQARRGPFGTLPRRAFPAAGSGGSPPGCTLQGTAAMARAGPRPAQVVRAAYSGRGIGWYKKLGNWICEK